MTKHRYTYRLAGTDMTVALELPEGHRPPSHIMIPSNVFPTSQRYQLVTPPEPKPKWNFQALWSNGNLDEFYCSDSKDAGQQAYELTVDPQVMQFTVTKKHARSN